MRNLLVALLLCFGVNAFANCQCANDCKETQKMVYSVPEEMERTWNLTNFEYGLTFDLFEEKDDEEETERVLLVGKIPLCAFKEFGEFDAESLFSMMETSFGGCQEEGHPFTITVMPELIEGNFIAKRFQTVLTFGEDEEVLVDTHVLFKSGMVYILAVGMSDDHHEHELLVLTQQVAESIDFQ